MKGKRLSTQVNNNLKITCNGSLLTNVMNVKLLGLETDEELTFSEHITTVCKKVTQRIGLLKKITNHLPLKQRLLYYNALIRPVINYTIIQIVIRKALLDPLYNFAPAVIVTNPMN